MKSKDLTKQCKIHGHTRHVVVSSNKNGTHRYVCVKCRSLWVSDRRRKIKKMSLHYLGNECWACGFKGHASCFDFHHLDPESKSFNISRSGKTTSWVKIVDELDKCACVCRNCHSKIHANALTAKEKQNLTMFPKLLPAKDIRLKEVDFLFSRPLKLNVIINPKTKLISIKTKKDEQKDKQKDEYGLSNLQRKSHKLQRKCERPPYDQLLQEIKDLGYRATGYKYGVSDNAIRKWVKWYEKYEESYVPDQLAS